MTVSKSAATNNARSIEHIMNPHLLEESIFHHYSIEPPNQYVGRSLLLEVTS